MILGMLFIEQLWHNPYFFFSAAFLVIFSICCHEFMHAWVALKMGDPTAADAGHLTLNPLKQMGWFSLLRFAFFGLAWGQVPVNPGNFRKPGAAVKVALAGPLTNLVLAVLFLLLFALLIGQGITPEGGFMLYSGSVLNIVLFILNMIPIPGFDGYAVVNHFFPRYLRFNSEAATVVTVILILILFGSISFIFAAARFLAGKGLELLIFLSGGRQ